MHPHLKNGDVPTILPKNDQNRAKTALFWFLVWAPPLLRWGCISPQGIDYKCEWAFLNKTSHGPRYGDLILGVRSNGDPKLGGKMGKRSNNTPQKSDTFHGLKIWRRLWFSINRDLIYDLTKLWVFEVECQKRAKGHDFTLKERWGTGNSC